MERRKGISRARLVKSLGRVLIHNRRRDAEKRERDAGDPAQLQRAADRKHRKHKNYSDRRERDAAGATLMQIGGVASRSRPVRGKIQEPASS